MKWFLVIRDEAEFTIEESDSVGGKIYMSSVGLSFDYSVFLWSSLVLKEVSMFL
uniref:Uncharacterized protein n=1 Tax=Lepeophtheirus salmonis TaxID=72036 RepID=A0A0K2V1J8_LEPSM